jgi:hypothetical protein
MRARMVNDSFSRILNNSRRTVRTLLVRNRLKRLKAVRIDHNNRSSLILIFLRSSGIRIATIPTRHILC